MNSSQRVPQLHGQGLLIQQGTLGIAQQTLADGDLVDIGLEPLLAADVVALLAGGIAPAVLDLPAVSLAVLVQIDTAEHHAMVHGAFTGEQPLGLGHAKGQAAQHLAVLETVGVPITVGAVTVGVAVAAEHDPLPCLQLADGQILQLLLREVEPEHILLHHVTHKGLAVGAVQRMDGRGDDDDVIIQIIAHIFLQEGVRGQVPFAVIVLILVGILKVKAPGGLAVEDAQGVVDLRQHLLAAGGRVLSLFCHGPQFQRILPQLAVQDGQILGRAGGVDCLRHDPGGHHAVLFDQADGHIPLAAVGQRVAQQGVGLAVGQILIRKVEDVLKEEICLFQLIVERQIGGREGEILQIALGDHPLAQDVQGGEHPAAAALLLVGDVIGLDQHREVHPQLGSGGGHKGRVRQSRAGNCIGHHIQLRAGSIALLKAFQHPGINGSNTIHLIHAFFLKKSILEISILHGQQDTGTACCKVQAALQVAGVRLTQGAVAGELDGAALSKAAACHDDLIGIARFRRGFRCGIAVHGAGGLNAAAEADEGIGGIGIEAGHDIVVVLAVARDGLFAHQLQQALGIDGGLDGLTHHAGGIVEAKVHITGRFQRTAQLFAQTGGVQAVGTQLHQILPARDIAASGGDAAARVLDETAHHKVRTGLAGLLHLGELTIAVVHKDDDLGVGGTGRVGDLLNGIQIKGIALQVAAAALDMADLCPRGLLSDQRVIRGEVGLEGGFVVPDAVVHQGSGALALAVQTDHALQRIVGAAGSGQQGIPCPQQAEQGHRQRMGAALELTAHKGILRAHHLGKDLLELGAAGIPQAVAGGAQHIGGGHLGIGKGLEHFQLVVVPDLLHVVEIGLAELHGLFVQRQDFGFVIKKVVQH